MLPTTAEVLITLAMPVLLLFVLGFLIGAAGWQESAIEAGVAEWRVDPKTGETEFVWIKCQEAGL